MASAYKQHFTPMALWAFVLQAIPQPIILAHQVDSKDPVSSSITIIEWRMVSAAK